MSSQPNPVIAEFLVKDLDSVLKAMKDIEGAVSRVAKKSAAAEKMRASSAAGHRERQRQADMKAIYEQTAMLEMAQRQGNKAVSDGVKARAKAKIDAYKVADRAEADARKKGIAEAKKHSDEQVATALKTARGKIDAYKIADKELASARRKGESEAKKQTSKETLASKALSREKHRSMLEIQRGEMSAAPHLSPQARLAILRGAEGKSPEKQREAIEKVRDLSDENKARRAERKKALAEEKADQFSILKQINQQHDAAEKNKQAIRERSATMAGNFAKQKAKEEGDARIAEEKRVAKAREQFGKTVYGAGKNAVTSAGSIAGSLFRGVMNVGGGLSVEDSMQRELSFRGRASQIAVGTTTNVTQDDLMKSARSVGTANGIDPEEVLKGYEAVKKLDDKSLPQALRVMPHIASIAAATGADMGHLGDLAANITAGNEEYFQSDKVSNAEKDETLKRQLRVFTMQGIQGGVEVSDFAKYGARITAGATLFGTNKALGEGTREENEANLGAAAQLARQRGGARDAVEATLAAQRFATDLQKKHGYLKENFGVDVADKEGNLRNLEDVTVDLLKNDSSVTGISKFKIGERGNRFLTGAADLYRNAGGGEKGEAAVRGYFKKNRAQISEAEIEAKAKKRNAEIDKQLERAMIELRTEIGTKLVPVLPGLIQSFSKLVPLLSRLMDGVAKVANWAASNPFGGFAALVTGFFVAELAKAAVADTIKRMISGAGSGNAVPVIAAGIGAGLTTAEWVDKGFADENEKDAKRRARQAEAQDMAVRLRRGDALTPEQQTKALELTQQLNVDRRVMGEEMDPNNRSTVKKVTGTFGAVVGGEDFREAQLVEQREQARALKATTEAADELKKAMLEAAARMNEVGGSNGPENPGSSGRSGSPVGRRPGG